MQSDEISPDPGSQDSPKKKDLGHSAEQNQENKRAELNPSEELEEFDPTMDEIEYEDKDLLGQSSLSKDITKLTRELLS